MSQESGEKRRLEKKLQDTNEKLTKEEYLAKQAELERVREVFVYLTSDIYIFYTISILVH